MRLGPIQKRASTTLGAIVWALTLAAVVLSCTKEEAVGPAARPKRPVAVKPTTPTAPTTTTVAAAAPTTEALRSMVRRFGELVGVRDRIIASRSLEKFFDDVLPRRLLRRNVIGRLSQGTRLWLLDRDGSSAVKALSALKTESHVEPLLVPGYVMLSYTIRTMPEQLKMPGGDFEGPTTGVLVPAPARLDYSVIERERWWALGRTGIVQEARAQSRQCLSLAYGKAPRGMPGGPVPFAISPVLDVEGPGLCAVSLQWKGNPLGRFLPSNVFRLLLYGQDESGKLKPGKGLQAWLYIEPTRALAKANDWNALTLLWPLPDDCKAVRLIIGLNYPRPPGRCLLIDDIKVVRIAP